MLEDIEAYCTSCVVVIIRMRHKIQDISFFSSITKYMPALHSGPHQTLAHVNSALNWQFKWVTQTEYDTQNSIRNRWISFSLLYKEPEKYIESAHRSNGGKYSHALSWRLFPVVLLQNNVSFVILQTC